MEVEKEPEPNIIKQRISPTRFPKVHPTFLFTVPLKETYDNLATAQQMICNKYSPQDSIDSITPINSVKSMKKMENGQINSKTERQKPKQMNNDIVIVIDQNTVIAKQDDIIEVTNKGDTEIITDNAKYENSSRDSLKSDSRGNSKTNIFPLVDSLKLFPNQIEKVQQILDFSLSAEYPVEEDNKESEEYSNDGQEQNGLYNDYENLINDVGYETDNMELNVLRKSDNCIKIEMDSVNDYPEIIFNATITKYHKRNETKMPKRKMNRGKVLKKINFKCNRSKNIIHTQIEKYYNKNKVNIMHPEEIKKQICSNSNTNIVSREIVLKNISAKENLIEVIDLTVKNTSSDASIESFPSTAKKSHTSNVSDNTLTRKDSGTLQIEEDTDTVHSAIEMPPKKVYDSDVIVAAAAVAYGMNDNLIDTQHDTVLPNQEKYMNLECLTSTETLKILDEDSQLTSNSDPLMSNSVPLTININDSQQNELSYETLVDNGSSYEVSSSFEAYYNAKTSSELNPKNEEADYPQIYEAAYHQINEKKQKDLLKTVINLGLYPDTPSTSSAATTQDEKDKVIITDVKNYSYEVKDNDQTFKRDLNDNVLNKATKKPNMAGTKTIVLPNRNDIQALIEENEQLHRKCAEEARNPTNTNELLWEKLVSVIDIAVKRLEDTLSDKIIGEFKKSIFGSDFFKKTSQNIEPNREKYVEMMSGDVAVHNKEVSTREVKAETDQGLQCDIINKSVIDEIMMKLSTEGPQVIEPTTKSCPKIKPHIFGDIVEVLKPPLSPMVLEKGETVTISTLTHGSEFRTPSRLRTLFRPPLNFLRENVVVLTSVPTFFLVLLCLYGLVKVIFPPL